MKKFTIFFALTFFISPFIALAAAGDPCQDASWCGPGFYCNMIGAAPDSNGDTYGKCATGGAGASTIQPSPNQNGPAPSAGPDNSNVQSLQPTANPSAEGGFVSLTNIPGLTGSTAPSIPDLLNNLYTFCVGAAAVLAVLQLIHAGFLYIGSESVTKKEEGKHLIGMSLGGLLLVLSPYLVFSLINPSILNLDALNDHLPAVNVKPSANTPGTQTPGQVPTTGSGYLKPTGQLMTCPSNDCASATQACANNHNPAYGVTVTSNKVVCVSGAGNINPSAPASGNGACPTGETKEVQCVLFTSITP